ncbi:hypothetical protein A9Q84_01135 [Halobacteriovorax marinus]|uniref:Uncharacterized protein n=1 Tax=Halobacteriovorax marinus TaxID=97084 RepID=A0A1Y5FFX8_9BACT|nr:hypothetical protein A9Q84_01135 [Halobacteriovorax marinus]
MRKKYLLLMSVYFFTQSVFANGDLFNKSLKELMEVTVTVASKNEVDNSLAPSSVTVYTEVDIQRMSYYTLKELAAITPGFSSANIHAGQTNLMVRGQKVEGFDNNKVLILLDGLPTNHLRNGRGAVDGDLSLIGIEKVEFLKGPASALYGTGAFFGVINLTTKKAMKNTHDASTQLFFGSHGTRGVRAYSIFNNGEIQGKLRVAISKQGPTGELRGYKSGTKAYDVDKTRTNHGFDDANDYHVDASFKSLSGFFRDFTFGYFLTENTHGTFEDSSNFNGFAYTFSTNSIYAKYDRYLNEKLFLTSYLKLSESSEEGLRYNYNLVYKGIEGLVEGHYQMTSDSLFILGGNYDTRKRAPRSDGTLQGDGTGANSFVEGGSASLNTYSLFMQYQTSFDFLNGFLITAGLRYDNSQSDYSDSSKISPRLSLVQSLTRNTNLKFIYGTALRSPDLKSTLINAGVIQEGGSLKQSKLDAESVRSLEIAVTHKYENLRISASISKANTKDAINRRTFNGKDSYRNDTGKTKSNAIDFEAKYTFSKERQVFINYSYSKSVVPSVTNDSDLYGQEVEGTPTTMVNFGGYYKWRFIRSSLIGKFIDSFRVEDQSSRHKGFFLLDLNLSFSYSNKLRFELKATNLIGEDARVPNFQEQYFPRTFLANIAYDF